MSTQENVQIVKDLFAAMGRGDKQGLLALASEDIEWIIPGDNWPLAGTHRGTRDWRICFRWLSEWWKFLTRSPLNFWRRASALWSLALLREKLKPRRSRLKTILSSSLPFEMAN